MRPNHLVLLQRCKPGLAAGMIAVLAIGCSSSTPNTGAAGASPSRQAKKTVATAAQAEETQPAQSVFTIDQSSRDPFFPKAKRVVAVADTKQPATRAVDVPALLQQGFQGVVGSGEKRIGLINNVMLEPGRQTQIPISAGGQSKLVSVRCREVSRDSVVLEVQGYPEPLRVVRTAYNKLENDAL